MSAFDPGAWRLRVDADTCGLLREDIEGLVIHGVGQRVRSEKHVTPELQAAIAAANKASQP